MTRIVVYGDSPSGAHCFTTLLGDTASRRQWKGDSVVGAVGAIAGGAM